MSHATPSLVRLCPACGKANRVLYSRMRAGVEVHCGACQKPLPPLAEPIAVDGAADLEALLGHSGLPVLIDFWAPWCGPCKAVAPEIATVAARNAGRLLVAKVNTDVDPQVGARYRIQSIPTMAVYKDGAELARSSGARPAAAIERFVASTIGTS